MGAMLERMNGWRRPLDGFTKGAEEKAKGLILGSLRMASPETS
jgi:hypothetical protein